MKNHRSNKNMVMNDDSLTPENAGNGTNGATVRQINGKEPAARWSRHDTGGSSPTLNSLTFLVIGNHPLVAEGIRSLVEHMEICGEALYASTTAQALKVLDESNVDLILLDLAEDAKMDALTAIREKDESIPVIVLSVAESAKAVREAVSAGASGYIVETAPLDFLVQAINVALTGKRLALLPLDSVAAYGDASDGGTGDVPESVREGYAKLTAQEEKVLALITNGLSNKEIARSLEIYEGTVKVHVKSILRKLNAKNRTVAALMAASLNTEVRDGYAASSKPSSN